MWLEEMKLLIHTCASKRKLVHRPLPVRKIVSRNISTFCQFVRNISTGFGLLSVIGNMSTNWKLSVNIHACHIRLIVALNHAQEFPAVALIESRMICNEIHRCNSL